jgi:hypothetical protein
MRTRTTAAPDYVTFEEPRRCLFIRMIHFNTGKEAFIAELDPPIQVQQPYYYISIQS